MSSLFFRVSPSCCSQLVLPPPSLHGICPFLPLPPHHSLMFSQRLRTSLVWRVWGGEPQPLHRFRFQFLPVFPQLPFLFLLLPSLLQLPSLFLQFPSPLLQSPSPLLFPCLQFPSSNPRPLSCPGRRYGGIGSKARRTSRPGGCTCAGCATSPWPAQAILSFGGSGTAPTLRAKSAARSGWPRGGRRPQRGLDTSLLVFYTFNFHFLSLMYILYLCLPSILYFYLYPLSLSTLLLCHIIRTHIIIIAHCSVTIII